MKRKLFCWPLQLGLYAPCTFFYFLLITQTGKLICRLGSARLGSAYPVLWPRRSDRRMSWIGKRGLECSTHPESLVHRRPRHAEEGECCRNDSGCSDRRTFWALKFPRNDREILIAFFVFLRRCLSLSLSLSLFLFLFRGTKKKKSKRRRIVCSNQSTSDWERERKRLGFQDIIIYLSCLAWNAEPL